MTYTPPQGEAPFTLASMAPPRRRRTGLVVALVAGGAAALLVVALAGGWALASWASRDAPATPAATSTGTATAAGAVVLQRGQFVWNSAGDPTCEGLQGFADLRGGAQVTVTDAGGKVLAIGTLAKGVATGITADSNGLDRATTCTLPFTVPDVPRGVGPYGVEVAHRGVVHYAEGQLDTIRMGF